MKSKSTCVLFTQDDALVRRLGAFLQSMTRLQQASTPEELERHAEQAKPGLFIFDLRSPDGLRVLQLVRQETPENVTIVLGIPRSDPVRTAHGLGVYASEDVEADRQRIQAQVRRGLEFVRLFRENQMLREAQAGTKTPPPAVPASPPRATSHPPLPYLSRAIRNFGNVDALLEGIVESVASTMLVSRAGLFSRTREGGAYRLRSGIRCLRETESLEYSNEEPIIRWLEVQAHLISRGNLEHIDDPNDRAMLKEALNTLGAELIIPMLARGRLIGWLFVGHRATGLPFEYVDLEELLAVAEHGTTLLENALLYEEVRVQKTLAETVLRSMPTGLVAVDPEGLVRWFNPAATLILGPTPEEVIGQPVEQLGTRMADLLRRALEDDITKQPFEWVEPRTGCSLSTQTRRLMTGADCMGAVALLYDRTTEQQLREKEERLERATFWTELAASMSHEVRNPLVAIKTFAQLLPERYEDPEFRSSFSDLVAKEVDRLNKIIQQIDDFANPPQLQFKAVDVKDTLRKGLDMAVLRIPQNGVSIEAKASDDLPRIRGDEQALAECFSEIITNAMEASHGRKKPRIDISTGEGETTNGTTTPAVTITVKDNAGGIPEEIREKVFSPFCTTKARGMGLGLPIARRTVTDHSGHLEIDSGKKGTAVRITLPAAVGNGSGQDETPVNS